MDPYETMVMVFGFLVSSGILWILVGSLVTFVIGRFAVVPTLRKIDIILDKFLELAGDGEFSPKDAEHFLDCIKTTIGEDTIYSIVKWFTRK